MARHMQRGATRADLLVTIGVLGILAGLVALLMPAVQSPRKPGPRSVCLNNLKQLALATAAFEVARGRYPGWRESMGGRESSWAVVLLPNLDNQGLYDLWSDVPVPNEDPRLRPYLPFLVCPSNMPTDLTAPHCSYVANAGFLPRPGFDATFEDSDPTVEGSADGVFVNSVPIYDEGGNLVLDASRVLYSDLAVDGISNTVLFSEQLLAGYWTRASHNSKYPRSTAPYYPQGVTVMTFLYASEHGPGFTNSLIDDQLPPPSAVTPSMKINADRRNLKRFDQLRPEHVRPSSNHPGVVMMAFADGHVMAVRENIDYRVY